MEGVTAPAWFAYVMLAAGGFAVAGAIRGLATGRISNEGLPIDRAARPKAFWAVLALELAAGAVLLYWSARMLIW